MMPNGNLICLIVSMRVHAQCIMYSKRVLQAELSMASNQHPLPTVTVGDCSFQDCPGLPRYRYLCRRGGDEVCHISVGDVTMLTIALPCVCMITLVRFDYRPAHIIIGAACLWISSSWCLTRNLIDINCSLTCILASVRPILIASSSLVNTSG